MTRIYNNKVSKEYSSPISQYNVDKRYDSQITFFKNLKSNEFILLQEPAIKNKGIPNVPKTHTQYIHYGSGRSRAAILLPQELKKKTMKLTSFCSEDIMVTRTRINNNTTIIMASIYMDITKPVPTDTIDRLTIFAERERLPLVVGTDSNAHHTAWGHPSCNRRGRDLLQSLSSNNLVLINSGSTPTFRSKQGKSVIDLTFTNTYGNQLINNWKVDTNNSVSGHEIIRYRLDLGETSHYATRSMAKCDWNLYQELVENSFTNKPFWFQPVANIEDLNKRQAFVNKILNDCFNIACPIVKGIRRSAIPWWNAELTKAKSNTKFLRKKAHKSSCESDWLAYKEQNKEYRKLICSAKRQGWKSFTSKIQGTKPTARIFKILNSNNTSTGTLNSVVDNNGNLTTSPQDTLQVMADVLIPEGGPQDIVTPSPPDQQRTLSIVSPERMDRAMGKLAPLKAPGPDGIRNEMLTKAWDWVKGPIRKIFYHSLMLGTTPDSWHETTGCISAKPCKPDYTNPRAFRIISLTSSYQKMLERLILWHLEIDLKIPDYLTKNQHGFRKGASTDSALHNITRRIEDANCRNQYSLGIFLDIEGAFDNISFKAMRESLISTGVPPTISDWIYHMISNRYISLNYCDHNIRKKATKGSPQGGVLSPFLWNITLNTLLTSLGYSNDYIQAFADDLVILIQGFCKNTLRNIAQSILNKINSWCHSKGLRLSALKTKVVLFTRKKDITLSNNIKVDGNIINLSPQVTYLGVILDSKLTWAPHIEAKANKGINMLFACKKAVGKTWGLTPVIVKWIYQQVILPSVLYGNLVWHHTLDYRLYMKQRLEALQRQAALAITRGLNSTNTANLEIMAALKPINLVIREQAIKSALRIKLYNRWDNKYIPDKRITYTSHAMSIDKDISNINIFKGTLSDWITTTTVLDRHFKSTIKSRTDIEEYINNIEDNTWQIYTDGSRNSSFTGAGFCVFRNNKEVHRNSFSLGTLPTVFQSELFALNMASIWAIQNINPIGNNIAFLSDSMSAINAINSTDIDSRLVLNTINNLNKLGIIHKVLLTWIPGHSNYKGNERADNLARQGSSRAPTGPEPFLPVSKNYLWNQVTDFMYSLHLKQYKRLNISDKGKIPLYQWLSKHKYKLCTRDSIHLKWLTWLLSGHSPLGYFQHKSKQISSPDCRLCPGEEETTEHFLAQCPGYATLRLNHLGFIITSLDNIINQDTSHIISFICATGRLDEDLIFN